MKDLKFQLNCINAELPAVQLDNGTWLFHAHDSCQFVDVATANNAARWIAVNVPGKWTQTFKRPGKKGRPGLYLLLPGFLYVLSHGNSEIGLKFRDEVYEVILPSIIEKGGYVAHNATSEQLKDLVAEISLMQYELESLKTDNKRLTAIVSDVTKENRDVRFIGFNILHATSEQGSKDERDMERKRAMIRRSLGT